MGRTRKRKSRANLREAKGINAMKEDQNKHKQKSQANLREAKGNDAMKEDQNKRKQKSQANLIEAKGNEAMKEDQNNRKLRSRDKLRVEKGPLIQRKEQNVWKQESRKRKLDADPKTLRNNESKRTKLSRQKKIKESPQKVKHDEKERQQKCRLVDSEKMRLRNFRQNTMFNAIFICICCQRKLFECNVTQFTDKLREEIEDKKRGLYQRAVELSDSSPITVNINGIESPYICLACKKHLKAGKLPPMSNVNIEWTANL